jgi:hypothetical protein
MLNTPKCEEQMPLFKTIRPNNFILNMIAANKAVEYIGLIIVLVINV